MEEVGRDVVSSEVSPPPPLQIPPLDDSRFRVRPCLSPCIPTPHPIPAPSSLNPSWAWY